MFKPVLYRKYRHDGDLVEVDADKGVVRILEKAEEK